MYNNIIFIGGVHGVGKGTVCQKIKDNLDFTHLSASEVLKWDDFNKEKGGKKVDDVSATQHQLIENLKKIVNPNKKYLLDGHFCLLKKDNLIERVPLKVFQQINPVAVIIVKEKPEVICERLQKRDGQIYNISQIEVMQEEEIESAKEVCTYLNIQLFESNTENINETIAFLQELCFFTGT